MRMLTKKKLEIILSKLKDIEKPNPELEQYTIPSDLAAEVLNIAYLSGNIEEKVILDLGCGSGRLTIGAALTGAKKVIGVDMDKRAIEITKENIKNISDTTNIKIQKKIELFCMDASEWKRRADTVIQNPPFGIQKLHADRVFLKKALESAKNIYSLHRHYEKSREFLVKLIEKNGGQVAKIIKFKFRIPYMFKFHK